METLVLEVKLAYSLFALCTLFYGTIKYEIVQKSIGRVMNFVGDKNVEQHFHCRY